ncbi:hypothetical protein Tsp_12221 [Trichinella spiralis]|uniref:hypothetical protein n=1 Tax=Trichinella spiralis TaxID=6334 RepID=UPI0001EFEC0E|nr:hypothetical protein Tsp_12221 [Trichinella spiralis]
MVHGQAAIFDLVDFKLSASSFTERLLRFTDRYPTCLCQSLPFLHADRTVKQFRRWSTGELGKTLRSESRKLYAQVQNILRLRSGYAEANRRNVQPTPTIIFLIHKCSQI